MLSDWLSIHVLDFYPATLTLLVFIIGYRSYTKLGRQRLHQGKTTRTSIQLIALGIFLLGLTLFIAALPINDALKGQLLSLLGILLSATIALSSTTVIGNAMGGIMLNNAANFNIGDFIQVNDYSGRITERSLLHTEIQSEDRNLTVLPNLYLVTHPYRIIHSKGTIISVELSLGYEVNRKIIEKTLISAAENAGLESPFMQVIELGDFSVSYRISGVLKEVKHRVTARSELHKAVLDALHSEQIEIVSPNFMNTRAQAADSKMIPQQIVQAQVIETETNSELAIESIVFDKAEEAETKDSMEQKLKRIEEGISKLQSALKSSNSEQQTELLAHRIENLKEIKRRAEKKLQEMKQNTA